ncbi:DNA-binding transcriptional MerR regulator [Allocatelliglobosispora scoriae]|uniref:DNA-binding transcriptional MerR regulator n=1 Tax=Allocatelliglobosispora scoriae TaxID=643052 RepID=A0A841C1U1_9ACTN|nr:MerR family transcriptional regulator [Allocatelliglobosispora scoriae]MBB5873289.1 DNA-binding transcriptional MerR regulator [Allocatelliglobosispora scoriae]
MSGEGLTAGDVARHLGIAVTTLRTWDSRYGLGPQDHRPGRHRRYLPADLDRLAMMRRLTTEGVPPAQAAAWVLEQRRPAPSRDGGGNTLAVGTAGPATRGLARAAMRLDAAAMRELLAAAIAEHGVVETWTGMIVPVLLAVGRKHAATQALVEVEHLLSGTVSAALGAVHPPSTRAKVLLACADEEQHTLPLEALSAALSERGVATRVLGARVPPAALQATIRRTGPDVLFLWSQTTETGDHRQLAEVAATRPRPKLIVAAGPGWLDLPAGIPRPRNLSEAVALVTAAPPLPRPVQRAAL